MEADYEFDDGASYDDEAGSDHSYYEEESQYGDRESFEEPESDEEDEEPILCLQFPSYFPALALRPISTKHLF